MNDPVAGTAPVSPAAVPRRRPLLLWLPALVVAGVVASLGVGVDAEPGKTPNTWIDVRSHAASGEGTRADPWVDALRNALAVHGSDHTYHLPGGFYQDSSALVIQNDNVSIIGDGGEGATLTTVIYEKDDGSSCWKFLSREPGKYLAGIHVRGIHFFGNMKATGAAIEIESIRRGVFDDILITRFQGDQTTWANKGVWLKGWDSISFRRLRCYRVTRCIFIDVNPNHPTIDADHFHFEDVTLVPGDKAHGVGIEVVADHVMNLVFDGTNTIAGANKGVYWHNRGKSAMGLNFTLENVRIEQGGYRDDSWGVFIEHSDTLRQFVARGVRVSSGYHGFYLRGVGYITMDNCFVMGGATSGRHGDRESGYTAYDIDAYGKMPVVMTNCSYMKWNERSQMKIADELVFDAGDALRIYQDGGRVMLPDRESANESGAR